MVAKVPVPRTPPNRWHTSRCEPSFVAMLSSVCVPPSNARRATRTPETLVRSIGVSVPLAFGDSRAWMRTRAGSGWSIPVTMTLIVAPTVGAATDATVTVVSPGFRAVIVPSASTDATDGSADA